MFITLEGVDGSGKTTQAAMLAEALGASAMTLREPGGTDAASPDNPFLAEVADQIGLPDAVWTASGTHTDT